MGSVRCKIQYHAGSSDHMCGTCKMGPDSGDSNTSVVDTKFRVRGVSNLRVVDASVFPEITNANINAAVMMMAEKAAEEIINFYSSNGTESLFDNKRLLLALFFIVNFITQAKDRF